MPIRVLIVDDHPLMRNALEAAISAASDMEVVAQAKDGLDALPLVATSKPDVIIMDMIMPIMDGLETIAELSKENADIRILVLSSAADEDKIVKAMQLGALGYITKDTHRDDLIKAIRSVAMGETFLPPKIAAGLINKIHQSKEYGAEKQPSVEILTPREKEVLTLIGQGHSNREIAEVLHLADATVRAHLFHMREKLGFDHRRELVVYAVKHLLNEGDGEN
jgi:DNA-binding NarL/FixJ family response regulator